MNNSSGSLHRATRMAFWPPWREDNLKTLARGMSNFAGFALFVMMVVMTMHVIGRKIGMPVPGAFEASEQLMVIVFSFPLAEIGLRKGQIVFELMTRAFPEKIQRQLEFLSHMAGLILFCPLTVKAWQVAWNMFSIHEYRQGIVDFPIWPFRVMIAIGLTMFCFQMTVSLVHELKRRIDRR